MMNKTLTLLGLLIFLSACVSTSTKKSNLSEAQAEPEIVQYLSKEIVDYHYFGHHAFDDGLGYTLRYVKPYQEGHFVDVYVGPIASKVSHLSHQELVAGYTSASLQDIYTAAEQGIYSDLKLISKSHYDNDGQRVSVHKLTMRQDERHVFSYLFVSEYNGSLLTANVTLDKIPRNENRPNIKNFVSAIFTEIKKYKQ